MNEPHTIDHALRPELCHHSMHQIKTCVICEKTLDPHRTHVDTCGERCYKRLLERQRREHSE